MAVAESSSRKRPGRGVAPAFWDLGRKTRSDDAVARLQALLSRLQEWPSAQLYEAVEQGVPTTVVPLLASALGRSSAAMMSLLDLPETTYRRNDDNGKPLPEVVGYRVMGLLRAMATLRRLLQESGDPEALAQFDLDAWVGRWIQTPLPEFGGRTPAQMLRNPEGQRALEALLERMRGGLPA